MSDREDASATETWFDAQRAYWDAWFSLFDRAPASAAGADGASPSVPWADALERWWQAVSPAAAPQARVFLERIVEQGKMLFRMSEALSGLTAGDAALRTADAWREALASAFAPLTAGFPGAPGGPAGEAPRGTLPFWEMPLDNWRRTVSSLSPFPGDALGDLKARGWENIADTVHERIDRFLSVPGLGYTREWQEQIQEWARLGLDYQRAFQDYLTVFARLEIETLERLSQKLAALAEKGDAVTSLRGLYDVWVDAAEEVYNERVSTDEYAEIYGRLTNALMALKRQGRNLADETLGTLGMPTHESLVTLQRRQQELRRDVRGMRLAMDGGGSAELSGEVRTLREEVARLREELARSGAAKKRSPGGPARRKRSPGGAPRRKR